MTVMTTSRLTRTMVVEAAAAIAERDGLEAASMRRIGDELGVSTMASYRHVPSRQELDEELVARAFARYTPEHFNVGFSLFEVASDGATALRSITGLERVLTPQALSGTLGEHEPVRVWLREIAFRTERGEAGVGMPAVIWAVRGAAEEPDGMRALGALLAVCKAVERVH